MSQRWSVTSPAPRSRALDGFRALLALMVTGYHLGAPGAQAAILAVPAFFALSGLLITAVLLALSRNPGRVDLRRFLLDRALRVMPPALVVIAVVGFLWPFVEKDDQTSSFAAVAGATLTGTTNLFRTHTDVRFGPLEPLWSVAAEGQFYLTWPLLLLGATSSILTRRLLPSVLPVIIVGLVVTSAATGTTGTPQSAPPAYYSVTLSFACLLIGAAGALIVGRFEPTGLSRRAGRILTWAGLVSTVSIALAVPPDWKTEPWVPLVLVPLTAGSVTAFAIGLRVTETGPARVLSVAPLAWFGRHASYSLYLWHLPVSSLLPGELNGLAEFIAAGTAAICVALLSACFIERPVETLRRRITGSRSARGESSTEQSQ